MVLGVGNLPTNLQEFNIVLTEKGEGRREKRRIDYSRGRSMIGDEGEGSRRFRPSVKALASLNNYSRWKQKLRENCLKRVREDRTRLLWKLRLPETEDHFPNREEVVESAFQDIISDELRKIKGSAFDGSSAPTIQSANDDMIWEYDGLHTAYQGDCEQMLLEMQRIFYDDLRTDDENTKESSIKTCEDEEDEYLARMVYEHMQLETDKVGKEVWCPTCKRGELQENGCNIYCNGCELKLKKGFEVDLDFLRRRLGEAHADHTDRGCRWRPEFVIETKFELTALYIKCQGCNTFEVVL